MSARRLGGAVVAVVLLLSTAGPALAHVSVNPDGAPKGSRAKVAFRVPNERDDVQTVRFEVLIPAQPVIQSVRTRPVAGWRVTAEKTTLARPVTIDGRQITEVVTRLVWEGGSLKGGEFEEFEVTLGPLPKTDKIVFKAIQTLSNGETTNWFDEATPQNKDPEHSAPVLTLTAAEGDGHGHAGAIRPAAATGESDDDEGVDTAALVAGVPAVLALLVSFMAMRAAKANRA